MKIGWIKLHRQFKEWEWYNKSEMVHLFIHCLIKANFKDSSFQGRECKKGSFITSLNHLSKETNISIQTIRTCLKKLELTKEITIESTHKLTHITICNFDSYQEEEVITNKQATRKQHTTNKQLTTIEERKEYKEDINNIDARKLKFSDTIKPFLDLYGRDVCLEFYLYWTEPNKSGTKLKFEIERTWDIKRRLRRWVENDFSKNKKPSLKANTYIPQNDLN